VKNEPLYPEAFTVEGEGAASEPRVSLVLPACDGAERISSTLNRVAAYLDRVEWESEVVVVDDGNRDSTHDVVSRWKDRFDSMVLVRHKRRRGPGAAARSGVLLAKGKYVVLVETGFSARIEELEVLVGSLAAGADVAIGSRKLSPDVERQPLPAGRLLTETAFTLASKLILPTGVRDLFCGLVGMRRRSGRLIASRSHVKHSAYLIEWMALAQYLGQQVIECPVRLVHGGGGRSSLGLLDLVRLGDLWSIRRRLAGFEYSQPQPATELMHETSFVRIDREKLVGAGGRLPAA